MQKECAGLPVFVKGTKSFVKKDLLIACLNGSFAINLIIEGIENDFCIAISD